MFVNTYIYENSYILHVHAFERSSHLILSSNEINRVTFCAAVTVKRVDKGIDIISYVGTLPVLLGARVR
jgi:hypothetical protein